jgi:head-tail adaptor
MSFSSRMNETIQVLRPRTTTDEFGDTTPDYKVIYSSIKAAVIPAASQRARDYILEEVGTQNRVRLAYRIYTFKSYDIRQDDRIVWRGRTIRVHGSWLVRSRQNIRRLETSFLNAGDRHV